MIRLLLAIGLVTLAVSTAAADPKRVAVHDKQAKKYFDAGQYDDAITEFQASYRLDKKPVTLFKIATAYYKKTDYTAAVEYYQKYLDAAPDGPLAQEAIDFSAVAKKELADRAAKKAAEEEAARKEAERKAAEAERERKKLAATGHVKQAEAYEKAATWISAGDEYTTAAKVSDDPSYLLLAAEAYRRQDKAKARAALTAYLEKLPTSPDAEKIRGDIAMLAREIDQAANDERDRQRKLEEERERVRLAALGPKEVRTYQKSYRWQTGGADFIGASLVLVAFLDSSATEDPLFYIGTIISVGATPGLHGFRKNTGRAVLSVLMRVAIIGFGSIIATATGHTQYLDPGGFPYVAVPMVAWMITDTLLMSKETKIVVEKKPSTGVALFVLPAPGGGTLGLGGSF